MTHEEAIKAGEKWLGNSKVREVVDMRTRAKDPEFCGVMAEVAERIQARGGRVSLQVSGGTVFVFSNDDKILARYDYEEPVN